MRRPGSLRWQGRRRLAVAYAVGALGYAIGLALSALFDLPSGPTVVCALAGVALLTPMLGKTAGCGIIPAGDRRPGGIGGR